MTQMANNLRTGWIVALVVCGVSTADADGKRRPGQSAPVLATPTPEPPPPPSDDTPWGKGVSAEAKAAAQALLNDGNTLFLAKNFREALEKYQAAIASWDHPAIRFNIVRTLIALERPLDAATNLEPALAFGQAPFADEALYTEALNYQLLLAGQIAEYEVKCTQAGVRVKLDGQRLLDCPGTKSGRVLPGMHVIVGQKPDHLTSNQDVLLLPGKKQVVDVELRSLAEATVYTTRWQTWKPWAVMGGGAALAGVGLLLDRDARNDLDQLDRTVQATCSTNSCTRAQYEQIGYEDAESRALIKNRVAIAMIATGAGVVITGVVGVLLNRPRAATVEQAEPMRAQLVPTVTGQGGGLALVGRF
jgi:hypothetical protein